MTRVARIRGPRMWLATVVLLVAIGTGLRSMSPLLVAGQWWGTSLMLTGLVALFVAVLRQMMRSRLPPTAWGLIAAVIGIAALYGDARPGLSAPQPTAETVEHLRLLVDSGVQAIAAGRVPVDPTRGLELLVVTGTVLTYLVAELIAVGLGRGGLAGLAVVALWAPAVVFGCEVSSWLLLVGGVTYLLLLAVTRTRSRRDDRPAAEEAPAATTAAAGLTVVALTLGACANVLPFYGATDLPSGWGDEGLESPLRISTDLDMRADLESRSDRVLLRYSGDGDAVGALRMYTLSAFDGQQWKLGAEEPALRGTDGVLWPEHVEPLPDDGVRTVEVEVLGLNQDHLPIPTEPRSVRVDGSWLYDPEADEVLAFVGTSTRGISYVLRISPRELTADRLRSDTGGQPPDAPAFLTVPATEREADIRALAQQIVADATTTYDQALALQSYLRSTQNFTYDNELGPARSGDAVWDFLTDRRGYCVQFATAMTIMARTLGIPARMAVGFLPGRADEEVVGQYLVSARQAHAWPELYFEDAGWVRFEPTPARQSGPPPIYADPLAGLPIPEEEQGPTSTPVPSEAATEALPASGGRSGYVSIGAVGVPIALLVGVGAILVIGLAIRVIVVRRRRAAVRVPQNPEESWTRMRERLAVHGIVWTDATTPRQAAQVVRERLPHPQDADQQVLTDARRALGDLVTALETQRYTTRQAACTPTELSTWVDAVEQPLAPTAVSTES
jgi:hypothetical protein